MILELSQQVCSLDLAKRLAELGAPQDSLFYWVDDGSLGSVFGIRSRSKWESKGLETYAAYTVAELGELLPAGWYSCLSDYYGADRWVTQCWQDSKWAKLNLTYGDIKGADTEVDTRAILLIYLLEQGHVKL